MQNSLFIISPPAKNKLNPANFLRFISTVMKKLDKLDMAFLYLGSEGMKKSSRIAGDFLLALADNRIVDGLKKEFPATGLKRLLGKIFDRSGSAGRFLNRQEKNIEGGLLKTYSVFRTIATGVIGSGGKGLMAVYKTFRNEALMSEKEKYSVEMIGRFVTVMLIPGSSLFAGYLFTGLEKHTAAADILQKDPLLQEALIRSANLVYKGNEGGDMDAVLKQLDGSSDELFARMKLFLCLVELREYLIPVNPGCHFLISSKDDGFVLTVKKSEEGIEKILIRMEGAEKDIPEPTPDKVYLCADHEPDHQPEKTVILPFTEKAVEERILSLFN